MTTTRRAPPRARPLRTPRPGAGACFVRETKDPLAEGWLLAAKQGSEADFVELCRLWQGPLMNFATSYVRGDAATAQDIVQETFVTAWQKIDQIKDAERLKPWLYRVARFKAINWLRKHRPKGRPQLSTDVAADRGHDVEGEGFDPLQRALRVEPGNPWIPALHEAIAELPEIYVAVVRLHYMRRLTAREIALLLELNLTTVKMRLLRARQLLKPMLLARMGREP